MLAPLHALAGTEILEGTVTHVKQIAHDRVGARHVDRPVRISQAERLLGRQRKHLRGGVIFHVAAGGLVGEPFAHVPFVGAGLRCELAGCHWCAGERPVEAELVADRHQHRADRRAQIADGFPEECVQALFINYHVALLGLLTDG